MNKKVKGKSNVSKSNKRVSAIVAVASILVAGGGLIGGHFAYKAGVDHGSVTPTVASRVKINSLALENLDSTTTLKNNGDVECDFKTKDGQTVTKLIENVYVTIGARELLQGDEYTVEKIIDPSSNGSDKCRKAKVTIKSGAITKYTGTINITPKLVTESFTVYFYKEKPETEGQEVELNNFETVESGKSAHQPPITKEGYEVDRWVTIKWNGGTPAETTFNFGEPVSADIKVYPVWKKASEYWKFTFDYNYKVEGTEQTQTVPVKDGTKVERPKDPTRDGYLFLGWNTEKDGSGQAFDFDSISIESDKTIYAQWDDKCVNYERSGTGEDTVDAISAKHEGNTFEDIVISSDATTSNIKAEGFKDCTKMKTIHFPSNLTQINANAFKGCTNLTYVDFADKNCSWVITKDTAEGTYVKTFKPSNPTDDGNIIKEYLNTDDKYIFTRYESSTQTLVWDTETCTRNIDIDSANGYNFAAKVTKGGTTETVIEDTTTETYTHYSIVQGNDLITMSKKTDGTIMIKPISTSTKGGTAIIQCKYDGYETIQMEIEVGSFDKLSFETSEDGSYATAKAKDEATDLIRLVLPYRCYDETNNGFIPVTKIASEGFKGCYFGEGETHNNVFIHKNVTSIGEGAFSGCGERSITFEDNSSLTKFESNVFASNVNLTSINLPSSLTSIEESAFNGCTKLSSINFNNATNLVNISENAFVGTAITSMAIPACVTSLSKTAFDSTKITTIKVSSSNPKYSSQNSSGTENNVVVDKDTGVLLFTCKSTSGTGKANYIMDDEFNGSSITSMTINTDVKTIGNRAFQDCTQLSNLIINEGVTSIGDEAFKGCTALKSITLPKSITSLGKDVFAGCEALTSVIFTGGSSVIGEGMFKGCTKLTLAGVTFNDITEIPNRCFENCTGIGTAITIPSSITSIGDSAFFGCTGITSITTYSTSTSGYDILTSIGDGAFQGCEKLESIKFGSKLSSIGVNVFSGCSKLNSITVSESNTKFQSKSNALLDKVTHQLIIGTSSTILSELEECNCTSIADNAFSGCSGLTSIDIPGTVTYIGSKAFADCAKVTSITIGTGVTTICESAFSGCAVDTGNDDVTIKIESTNIDFESNPGGLFSVIGNLKDSGKAKKVITIPDSISVSSGLLKTDYTYSEGDKNYTEKQKCGITCNIENGTYSGDTVISQQGCKDDTTATVTISPNTGYSLPSSSSITVTNATLDSYNSSTGEIKIKDASNNVTITATCPPIEYSITSTITNGSTTSGSDTSITVENNSEANAKTVTITPNTGYSLPSSITVSGAEYTYNSSTGEIKLWNPTENVTITVVCQQ